MSIRRKLFLTFSSVIVGMGVLLALLMLPAVWGILHMFLATERDDEIQSISAVLEQSYNAHGHSWAEVEEAADAWAIANPRSETHLLLLEPDDLTRLYAYDGATKELLNRLGIRHEVTVNGETAAILYYGDQEVLNQAKLRYGMTSSISALLVASTIITSLIAMIIVYVFAQRLTAPLNQLVPAIDRLSQGEWGVQTKVNSSDELGRLAQAFNEMSAQLRRYEELRRNLVADVAHELRTPVTIIQGKLELVQHSVKPVNPEDLLPIQDELIRLTRLIDDLHLLSRAEARQLPLERRAVNIGNLVEQVVEHVTLDAAHKQQHIQLQIPAEPIMIPVDPHRMTQVLLNLLQNAVRYTPEGGTVTITAVQESLPSPDEHKTDMLRLTIADTGAGIASDQLPFLFNRFYRTDEARSRHTGGMGLGLAIAKELVLAHGGTIDVESERNEGTRFIVRLPMI